MSTTRCLHVMRLLLLALLVGLLRVGWGPVLAAPADPFFAAVCHAGGSPASSDDGSIARPCPACLAQAWALTPFVDPRWHSAMPPPVAPPPPHEQPPAALTRLASAQARAPPRG